MRRKKESGTAYECVYRLPTQLTDGGESRIVNLCQTPSSSLGPANSLRSFYLRLSPADKSLLFSSLLKLSLAAKFVIELLLF